MHVLITGCSTGIGRAAVEAFARSGHRVFATARKLSSIEDLRSERIGVLRLDVTEPDSIRSAVKAAQAIAPIDVVVHNAGYGQMGPLVELSHGEMLDQFETNVFGLMELTKAVVHGANGMIARRAGRLVMVSSIVGQVAIPFSGAYSASKFALRALSDVLRLELAPFGIKVVQVEPGPIKSRFADNAVERAAELLKRRDTAYEFVRPFMENRMRRSQDGALPAAAAAKVILRAATARNPATRYTVTPQAKGLKVARFLLSEKALDRILARVFGLNRKP